MADENDADGSQRHRWQQHLSANSSVRKQVYHARSQPTGVGQKLTFVSETRVRFNWQLEITGVQ